LGLTELATKQLHELTTSTLYKPCRIFRIIVYAFTRARVGWSAVFTATVWSRSRDLPHRTRCCVLG